MHAIVSASPKDAALLADLEVRSEAYWGYSSKFMEKFKRIYLITEEFIADHPTSLGVSVYRTCVYRKRIWQNPMESCSGRMQKAGHHRIHHHNQSRCERLLFPIGRNGLQ